MRYSLLSRFQGALLGIVLGEALGRCCDHSNQALDRTLNHSCLKKQALSPSMEFSQILYQGSHSLIHQGTLAFERFDREFAAQISQPVNLMAATLPVALFLHEQPQPLQQQLAQLVALSSLPGELKMGVFAVALAIAEILDESFTPNTLIPKIIAQLPQPAPVLVKQLERVQSLWSQPVGLAQVKQQLQDIETGQVSSIALAFYCFLSTLEDFHLTVSRAVWSDQSQLTVMAAAALAGAYNSVGGIPPKWQLKLQPQGSQISSKLNSLAAQLLAAWAGTYQPLNAKNQGLPIAIAAPRSAKPE